MWMDTKKTSMRSQELHMGGAPIISNMVRFKGCINEHSTLTWMAVLNVLKRNLCLHLQTSSKALCSMCNSSPVCRSPLHQLCFWTSNLGVVIKAKGRYYRIF